MTDIGIAAVARGCLYLRHLGAGGCIRVTDASIRVVAIRAAGNLRVLDVAGCRGVSVGYRRTTVVLPTGAGF